MRRVKLAYLLTSNTSVVKYSCCFYYPGQIYIHLLMKKTFNSHFRNVGDSIVSKFRQNIFCQNITKYIFYKNDGNHDKT